MFWVFPTWVSLSFLDLLIHIFHQSWEVFVIIFSNILSAPSSSSLHLFLFTRAPNYTLLCLVVSHRSLMLCSFFPPFFFIIFRLDNLNWSVFKPTDSFSLPACLLLISSSELSFQLLYCVFQLQNFHLGLFSWNLSLHWYFLLVRNYSHDFLYCFRNGLF